jgi:carbamoyl-phosphate synthase large subunit/carbamoyl-phosphate synthase small subunit
MYRAQFKVAASMARSSGVSLLKNRSLCQALQSRGYVNWANQAGNPADRKKGYLVLEDGTTYEGISFGADTARAGEAVFNTGMVGYPESITDPSYRGQILSFTYPLLGNYGVPPHTKDEWGMEKFFESANIHTEGIICADYSWEYSHWNADKSLGDWLKSEDIPGLTGIDTRALTKKLRENGTMMGKIMFDDQDIDFRNINDNNLAAEVSTKEVKVYGPDGGYKVIAVDCGIKYNVIRALVEKGCQVHLVPYNYNFIPELESEEFDGLFISNGPGDPAMLKEAVSYVEEAYSLNKPVFGICMGNHVMAQAAGATTYKMPFGNRGQNQPVVDTSTNMAYITPQNHGYAVDTSTLRAPWKQAFYNANDYTNEGISCEGKPFYSVQFHPEAKGGPYDTDFLFDRFINDMKVRRENKSEYYTLPAKKTVKKVLILGSGGLQIGQAGEFDYSGSQAIKALQEEGIKTILMNPNIATVQTAKGLADRVYFLPVSTEMVEAVIEKEKPDGVLLGFGGQTGLNVGIDVWNKEIFQKNGVQVLGTSVATIVATEDREIFKNKLEEIDVPCAKSFPCVSIEEVQAAAKEIGYPCMMRSAFALGGLGSGFCHSEEELLDRAYKAFAVTPQVLVEKSVKGWKEVEYEVVRDAQNNCVTVCNMENFDPMGIHTGESIVIAPSQTLSNEEYHKLRLAAIRTVQHLGIIGECNIQYALDPESEEFFVIEVNPRLSRSSALASKATGYPLAAVAAKLSLGNDLTSITNSITKSTTACFEPSLDYLVVKMPRWDMEKFTHVDPRLGSAMKSVGEVMAIGRCFEEAMQKAIRMVDVGNTGFDPKRALFADDKELWEEIEVPTPKRIFALAQAMEDGTTVKEIYERTCIDPWWLMKLQNINGMKSTLAETSMNAISKSTMHQAKKWGFSDIQIANIWGEKELDVREARKNLGVTPHTKQIDTLAAEFPAKTNYLYVTYGGTEHDLDQDPGAVMVLGSGVYRIGSSVEFDYGAVSCARALRREGKRIVMINYNPETVSTDYDESERLYFEELSQERVMDIQDFEQCGGIVVSVGGQQPQNLALPLYEAGLPILGTSPIKIDNAEDRGQFGAMLDAIGVDQPEWMALNNMDEALAFADRVTYPVLVRPSYVLSGAAMKVAHNSEQLEQFLNNAASVSPDHPVVMTKFWTGAEEIELDGVACDGKIVNWAVSEHIEFAGVHSGDATLIFPSDKIPQDIQTRVKEIGAKVAAALEISGPFNIQFLEKDGELSVIECNLRSSRSFPFVSKALNVDFIETATKIFLGQKMGPDPRCDRKLDHVSCKSPQFSYARLPGTDPILGVEMASTGEVACYGKDRYEAYMLAILSAGFKPPQKAVLISGNVQSDMCEYVQKIHGMNLKVYATPEVHAVLDAGNVKYEALTNTEEEGSAFMTFRNGDIDFVINFPYAEGNEADNEEMRILRRHAVNYAIAVATNERLVKMTLTSMEKIGDYRKFGVRGWDEYFAEEKNSARPSV